MYLASCAGIAWRTAEFIPEYPARGRARALDEENTVAPIAAVTAQKAMTDPFCRIVTSHSQQCAASERPHVRGWRPSIRRRKPKPGMLPGLVNRAAVFPEQLSFVSLLPLPAVTSSAPPAVMSSAPSASGMPYPSAPARPAYNGCFLNKACIGIPESPR